MAKVKNTNVKIKDGKVVQNKKKLANTKKAYIEFANQLKKIAGEERAKEILPKAAFGLLAEWDGETSSLGIESH